MVDGRSWAVVATTVTLAVIGIVVDARAITASRRQSARVRAPPEVTPKAEGHAEQCQPRPAWQMM